MSGNFFLRSLLLAMLVTAGASAQTLVWNGASNSDFTVAGNWFVGTTTTPSTLAPAASDTLTVSPTTTGGGAVTVYPALAATSPASGSLTSLAFNLGSSMVFNSGATLTTSAFNLYSTTTSSVGPTITVNSGATVNVSSSNSYYWQAGTANIYGAMSINRTLYVAQSGSATYPHTMTINILDGGSLGCGNQNGLQLGGSGNTNTVGIINIWGKNGAGTGSVLSFGNGTTAVAIPRTGSNNSYITLKNGGRIEYPHGSNITEATFTNAINNNYIRSADVRELLVQRQVAGSTTRWEVATVVQNKAYSPVPASKSPAKVNDSTNGITLVTLGTQALSWKAPLETYQDYTSEQKLYTNFATGIVPVDPNGYPTDPNGDYLLLAQTIARAASAVPTIKNYTMTSAVGGIYAWRVDSIDHSKDGLDPNWPKTYKGTVWYFRTGNSAPTALAGPIDSGTGLPAMEAVSQAISSQWTSNATISDDGLPIGAAVTGTWTQVNGPVNAIPTPLSVTKANPNITLNLTTTGRYQFQLVPFDTDLTGAASVVNVNVYADSCAAAKASGFTALAGDYNLDCKVNFTDFATIAGNWAACSSQLGSCN
jgi:hypothetical protein